MVRQTPGDAADHVRQWHCVSHPLGLHEVQAPIRAAGSEEQEREEQKQGPIAAVQTLGWRSGLPVEAVAVGMAKEWGRCECNCVHEYSHDHNRILSAHSRHIRVLPAQLIAELAAEVEEAEPAHSHSHSHSHSRSHGHGHGRSRVHSQCHDMNDDIRPPPLGKRKWEDARARTPRAVLAAARRTGPDHTSPDRRTACRRARTVGAHARECHENMSA